MFTKGVHGREDFEADFKSKINMSPPLLHFTLLHSIASPPHFSGRRRFNPSLSYTQSFDTCDIHKNHISESQKVTIKKDDFPN
ncbi:hypothetical protein HanIR_Chr10g0496381 [Helianthus annuus]|nr:hypothetical protein HanIR_Chr10g0496381 [Helianthus annuus]